MCSLWTPAWLLLLSLLLLLWWRLEAQGSLGQGTTATDSPVGSIARQQGSALGCPFSRVGGCISRGGGSGRVSGLTLLVQQRQGGETHPSSGNSRAKVGRSEKEAHAAGGFCMMELQEPTWKVAPAACGPGP